MFNYKNLKSLYLKVGNLKGLEVVSRSERLVNKYPQKEDMIIKAMLRCLDKITNNTKERRLVLSIVDLNKNS